jgi:ribosome assembly protein SQT1
MSTDENQEQQDGGHEDYQEEFIHDGEILEELALNDQIQGDGDESMSDDEMPIDEQPLDGEQQDIPDDSVQGFYAHKEPVFCVSLHPLLPIAATGGGDDQSMMWNYQSGELIAILASNQN